MLFHAARHIRVLAGRYRLWAGLLLCLAFLPSAQAQLVIAGWNFPNSPDDATVDVAVPINAGRTIQTVGGTGTLDFGNTGATTQSAWCTGWNGGNGTKYWQVEINTTGYYNLEVSSKQRSSSTGPTNFALQYRIGLAGVWTAVTGAGAIVCADNFTSGVVNAAALPAACENQPSLFLRWIMTSNTSVGGGAVAAGGSSRIDDIIIAANSTEHFRTLGAGTGTGNWHNPAIWEVSATGAPPWVPTAYSPSHYAQTITIRNGDVVTLTANASMDQLTVDAGGVLDYANGVQDLRNGTGVDMQVNGTFIDGSTSATTWETGTTWALGTTGTYIKSSGTTAANWQNNYEGGIGTIPPAANWVIRKVAGANPPLATSNMVYPNLVVENMTAGNWNTATGSTFQGGGVPPVILGILDVGGTGTSTVTFYNNQTNTTSIPVNGDLIVRAGSTLSLGSSSINSTGLDVLGDVTCDGTLTYGTFGGDRRIRFHGPAAQAIAGSGTFSAFKLVVEKSMNDVALGMSINVANSLNLISGRMVNDGTPYVVSLAAGSAVTGASDNSFVTGRVRKYGNTVFTFPIGKGNSYRPATLSITGGTGDAFTAEYFNTSAQGDIGWAHNWPAINHVSDCEYWRIDRSNGSPNATVTLSWRDPESCGVTDLPEMRVAYWDGSQWVDRGNGGTTGTTTLGTVATATVQASFTQAANYWTLASVSTNNPLPIELLSFTAEARGQHVDLRWATASEKDNDRFTVERSADAMDFTAVLDVPGAGNSQAILHYEGEDPAPLPGLSYYRLRQTDLDGTSQVGEAVPVFFNGATPMVIQYGNDGIYLRHASGAGNLLEILDATGRPVTRQTTGPENVVRLPMDGLAYGAYILRLTDGTHSQAARLVY